jgi:hypothetical protein
MDDEYFKEQAAHVRKLASMADPFIKRRLLDLAEKYDARMGKPSRATVLLKTVRPQSELT